MTKGGSLDANDGMAPAQFSTDSLTSQIKDTKRSTMKNTISVGVVGCGYWGPNLARNFNANSDCRLGALCDRDDGRLKHMRGLYPAAQAFSDFEKFLSEADVDAVAIATPVSTHFSLAKKALEAGKHVIIEKPMASSSEQCEELIVLAERKQLTLMVGHTFLYSEPVRKIKEIISKGDIGELRYINSQRLNLGLFQKDINVAWDLAPHDISIILHVLNDSPVLINCQGNGHVTPDVQDITNMSLMFSDRRFATIQSSWLEPRKVRQMTFVGEKRMIVYDDLQPLEKIRIYDVRVERPPFYDSLAEFQYSYHYGDSYIPRIEQEEPLKRMCQHFLDCIDSGDQPLTCGRKGLELVRILEASSESMEASGAPVPFKAGECSEFLDDRPGGVSSVPETV
jgi:predicted dehydrogenase